jgi:CRISPR-associated protein Csd2
MTSLDLDRRILDPRTRHDFVYIFDVTNGNPNGDPDAGNMPRFDPETMHGLVTDVCLKRKVRNYVQLAKGQDIFIQTEEALNTLIEGAFKKIGVEAVKVTVDEAILALFPEELSAESGLSLDGTTIVYSGEATSRKDILKALKEEFDGEVSDELEKDLNSIAKKIEDAVKGKKGSISKEQRLEARDAMIRDYYDVRMFGAVMSTGLNAGQVRGPMQISFARSIDPIRPMDLSITRQARTTTERMKTGSTEIGRKAIVPYGLYRAHGFYNPAFAEQVTEEDLEIFWEALVFMFEHDRSAARGEMACRGLYVFSHDNSLGRAPSHKLFQRIRVTREDGVDVPRNFADYRVDVEEDGLDAGVTLTRVWHE